MTTHDNPPTEYPLRDHLPQQGIESYQFEMIQRFLNGSLVLGTVLFFTSLFIAIQRQAFFLLILSSLVFVFLVLITFRKSISDSSKGLFLSIIFLITGSLFLFSSGLNVNGLILIFLSVLTLILSDQRRTWILFSILAIALLLIVSIVQLSGNLPTSNNSGNSIENWIFTLVIFLFLAYVFLLPVHSFITNVSRLFSDFLRGDVYFEEELAKRGLRISEFELLRDRINSFNLSIRQICRSLSTQISPAEIMTNAVDQLTEKFGYYYAAIFLADDKNEFAVLKAGTGEPGRQMLENAHRLRIREQGMVGFVVARGDLRLSRDVESDEVHYKNPYLPLTRSEVAIPLKIGNQTIGALDIQSDKANAFPDEELDILQLFADYLSTSIERALDNEKQADLFHSSELLQLSRLHEGVKKQLVGSKNRIMYRFKDNQIIPFENISPDEQEVLKSGIPFVKKDELFSYMLYPILSKGMLIGAINIKIQGIPPEGYENALRLSVDQLARNIEVAQVFQDLRDRTDREELVSQITTKVRNTRDLDTILQTTAIEIGQLLGVNDVRIQLKTNEPNA